jgi:hypothetical protein
MSANAQPKPVKPVPVMRRVIIYATLLPVVFLLGFVPMWLKSMEASRSLAETERQLSLAQGQLNLAAIQTALDSAVIEAQRGNNEPARQAASNFFTSLRAETDRGDASALSAAQREGVQSLLTQQDEIITLLARGSSASVNRLTTLYDSYLEIMNK